MLKSHIFSRVLDLEVFYVGFFDFPLLKMLGTIQ